MADYIGREAAVKLLTSIALEVPDSKSRTVAKCINRIELMPAADVVQLRHGRWVNKKGGFFEFAACSLCGEVAPTAGIAPNYCPSCGARMDLEDENHDN